MTPAASPHWHIAASETPFPEKYLAPSYPSVFHSFWVAGRNGAGQNEGMTRYSLRAVLLLFGVLYLTACATSSWQAVSLDAISPAQLIEEDRPPIVRVTTSEVNELELIAPRVAGDDLVAANGFSVALADILRLEVEGLDLDQTVLRTLGLSAGVIGASALAFILLIVYAMDSGAGM